MNVSRFYWASMGTDLFSVMTVNRMALSARENRSVPFLRTSGSAFNVKIYIKRLAIEFDAQALKARWSRLTFSSGVRASFECQTFLADRSSSSVASSSLRLSSGVPNRYASYREHGVHEVYKILFILSLH